MSELAKAKKSSTVMSGAEKRKISKERKRSGVILDSTFEIVQKIISKELGVDPDEIHFDSRLVEDFGADSLDVIELTMSFEEEFNIEIPDGVVEKMRTVSDVVKYISPDERERHKVSREYANERFGNKFRKAGN